MNSELFDKEFLRKLESLAFISRRLYRGQARGAHASVRRGTSLDFADFRAYQPGDDFRTIDWGIYGRLDKLVVRLFETSGKSCKARISLGQAITVEPVRRIRLRRR